MKKKYGQIIADNRDHHQSLDDDVIEYRRSMEKDVIKNIKTTINQALASTQYDNKDFYIVMLVKLEHIGQVPRTYILSRLSCPTPTYDQHVWKYHRDSSKLEFLWSIPDKILYYHIVRNSHRYLQDQETKPLAQYVLLMETGQLLEWVRKENGEKVDAVIMIDKETDGRDIITASN